MRGGGEVSEALAVLKQQPVGTVLQLALGLVQRVSEAAGRVVAALDWGRGRRGVVAHVGRSFPMVVLCALVGLWVTEGVAVGQLPATTSVGSSFLDDLTSAMDPTFLVWMGEARQAALYLFGILLPIQVVLTCGRKAVEEGFLPSVVSAADLVMRKGAWCYFIMESARLAPGIYQDLGQYGMQIAGSNLQEAPRYYHELAGVGLKNSLIASFKNGVFGFTGASALALIGGMIIFFVFAMSGWIVAFTMAYVKFVAVGGLVLLGLTALDATTRYGYRYIEFLVRGGLKQVGLALVLGRAVEHTKNWEIELSQAHLLSGGEKLLDIAMDSFGIVWAFLLVPTAVSSMANGNLGDAGESRVGGAAAALTQALATAGTGWMMAKVLAPGASAGGNAVSDAVSATERRNESIKQAAAVAQGHGEEGVPDRPKPSAAPASGDTAGDTAGPSSKPSAPGVAKQVGQAAGATMRGAGRRRDGESTEEDNDGQ